MLKLRVQIPDIGKEYDVQCNEKAYVEDMLQDILDLIFSIHVKIFLSGSAGLA